MKIKRKKGVKGFKIVEHNKGVFWTIIVLSIILAGILIYLNNNSKIEVSDFESCVVAGNPVMESYPRQCRHNDITYVEKIEEWKNDGIQLMQHETEGYYGCFGCNTPSESPALCVDPIPEMKIIQETEQRHCGEEFEVKTYCSEESRTADACIEIYQPVCGWNNEEIQCIKYPCASTYSNSCFACMDEKVEYYTEGECPE